MLIFQSGGLRWHMRAWLGHERWADFRQQIAGWLDEWHPDCDKLLLIGPSAGWTLPSTFFQRFRSVHCIDPDPLARPLFHRRHGPALGDCGPAWQWERGDGLADLPGLLARFPQHALLFANVLGQYRFHCLDVNLAERKLGLIARELRERHWASYHDRISGAWPRQTPMPAPFRASRPVTAEMLARRGGVGGEWLDHLTTRVLPTPVERRLIPWRITADALHWVEAGAHPPA